MPLFATFWEPVRMDQGQELSSSCSQAEQGLKPTQESGAL